jgi:hypothetical protein
VLREDIDGIDEFEAVIEVWEKVDWGQVEEGILDKLLVHPVINNFNTPSSTRTTQKHTQNWEHSNEKSTFRMIWHYFLGDFGSNKILGMYGKGKK